MIYHKTILDSYFFPILTTTIVITGPTIVAPERSPKIPIIFAQSARTFQFLISTINAYINNPNVKNNNIWYNVNYTGDNNNIYWMITNLI